MQNVILNGIDQTSHRYSILMAMEVIRIILALNYPSESHILQTDIRSTNVRRRSIPILCLANKVHLPPWENKKVDANVLNVEFDTVSSLLWNRQSRALAK